MKDGGGYFFLLLAASSLSLAVGITEILYGVIGRRVTLSFVSPTNRSIDNCLWTPLGKRNFSNPNSILSKLQNKGRVNDLLVGKCQFTIPSLAPADLGRWKSLVAFSSLIKNQSYHEIYFVNLVEAQLAGAPKIMEKEKVGSMVANSVTTPSLNNSTVTISCCIENGLPPPTLTFRFNGEAVMSGSYNTSNFCIYWEHTFNLDDNLKSVACHASQIALDEEGAKDSLTLNILHPPAIIDESKIDKEVVSKSFHPDDVTSFSFTFISNPAANFSWFLLGDNGTALIIDNNTNPHGNVFVDFNQGKKVWEVDFVLKNPLFVNTKKCYRIDLANHFGNTWMDFSVTQLAYATFGKLQQKPEVVDVHDGAAVAVRCCSLRIQGGSAEHAQLKVRLVKNGSTLRSGILGNDSKNPFCYLWTDVQFSRDDQDKLLECVAENMEMSLELSFDGNATRSSAAQLNVQSPFILSSGNVFSKSENRVLLNLTLNLGTTNEIQIEFVGNPKPSISKVQLMTRIDKWTPHPSSLNANGLVNILHQGNTGTLIFKPTEELRKRFKKLAKGIQTCICVGLENAAPTEICVFVVEPPKLITSTAPTSTLPLNNALPSRVRATTPSIKGSTLESSGTETPESSVPNLDTSTTGESGVDVFPNSSINSSEPTSSPDTGTITLIFTEFAHSTAAIGTKTKITTVVVDPSHHSDGHVTTETDLSARGTLTEISTKYLEMGTTTEISTKYLEMGTTTEISTKDLSEPEMGTTTKISTKDLSEQEMGTTTEISISTKDFSEPDMGTTTEIPTKDLSGTEMGTRTENSTKDLSEPEMDTTTEISTKDPSESEMGTTTEIHTTFHLTGDFFAGDEDQPLAESGDLPPDSKSTTSLPSNFSTSAADAENIQPKKPVILEKSKNLLIDDCNSPGGVNITFKFTADSTLVPNVTWLVLKGNGSYASIDKNQTTTDVIQEGLWETRLMVNDCRNDTSDGVIKSYFQLIVVNDYGTDELPITLDKTMEVKAPSVKRGAAMDPIIAAVVAGVLLVLVLALYIGGKRFYCRRMQRWTPTNEVKIQLY